jgi:hypothetical protein
MWSRSFPHQIEQLTGSNPHGNRLERAAHKEEHKKHWAEKAQTEIQAEIRDLHQPTAPAS